MPYRSLKLEQTKTYSIFDIKLKVDRLLVNRLSLIIFKLQELVKHIVRYIHESSTKSSGTKLVIFGLIRGFNRCSRIQGNTKEIVSIFS